MRFLTAGESHGPGLTVIIDNFPAGVPLKKDWIDRDLFRRQQGYGRSPRQKIETDKAEIQGGVRFEKTTGAPIALWIENKEHKNWTSVITPDGDTTEEAVAKKFTRPRPGHADLAGYYKYGHSDLRDVLERASARETAARVAAGAIAKALLAPLGINITSHVTRIGPVAIETDEYPQDFEKLPALTESNDLRCAGKETTLAAMREAIDQANRDGTSLGGEMEVIVTGLPPGLGSYTQWDRKLDGLLAQAIMSIQAVKSVSIGAGQVAGEIPGHAFQDEILPGDDKNVYRPTNRAGGLEGGVTNGMPLIVQAVMKPISTIRTPMRSLNLETQEEEKAHFERSDVTAVPACAVVCEAMVALILATAIQEKFGHDTLDDIQAAYEHYMARLSPTPTPVR